MLEEDKNIKNNIKDARNLFTLQKLKKETNDTVIKDIRSLFRLKKRNKAIKDRTLGDTRNFFEHEEEDYYKSVKVNDFWSNNYIEY